MILAFFVPRRGSLKVMGALIQAALDRRHEVVLLWHPAEAKPGERILPKDLESWPGARAIAFDPRAPLPPILAAQSAQALVATSLYSTFEAFGRTVDLPALGQAGVRTFSIDYVLDTVTSSPEGYRAVDVTFYTSEYQRRLHWRVQAEGFARVGAPDELARRSAVCGSPMLDQLAVVDRAAVRKRYGLDDGRPVVVFMSLKMGVPDPWRRLVWGREWRGLRAIRAASTGHAEWVPTILRTHGYRDLMDALARFCARHGAALVVKSRRKNYDPSFLSRYADVFLTDETVYPYTSMELIAIANLCVHFQSGAVIEAAFAGIPSLSVIVSQTHLHAYPGHDEIYGLAPESLQNYGGVVWPVRPEEAIARLERASLADFGIDRAARAGYVRRFLEFDDTASSDRVLDVIERAVRG